jgi:uncharacterized protein YueI
LDAGLCDCDYEGSFDIVVNISRMSPTDMVLEIEHAINHCVINIEHIATRTMNTDADIYTPEAICIQIALALSRQQIALAF